MYGFTKPLRSFKILTEIFTKAILDNNMPQEFRLTYHSLLETVSVLKKNTFILLSCLIILQCCVYCIQNSCIRMLKTFLHFLLALLVRSLNSKTSFIIWNLFGLPSSCLCVLVVVKEPCNLLACLTVLIIWTLLLIKVAFPLPLSFLWLPHAYLFCPMAVNMGLSCSSILHYTRVSDCLWPPSFFFHHGEHFFLVCKYNSLPVGNWERHCVNKHALSTFQTALGRILTS